jgi:hypothetical protein
VEEKMGRKEKAKDYFQKADSLSGYPPKKEVEVAEEDLPNQSEKSKATRPKTNPSKANLTTSHFIEVIHGIFTKPAVRKEFSTYLKGLFATKKG